jgi:cytochrome P450
MFNLTSGVVISDRLKSGHERGDLLDLMLSGKDSKTTLGLSEENVRYQVRFLSKSWLPVIMTRIPQLLTFLIAGHETTS